MEEADETGKDLHLSTAGDLNVGFHPWLNIESAQWLKIESAPTIPGFYQQGSGNFWVAEVDQSVVGTIGLLDIGSKQAALRKMFVAAPYRGKEHGVAQSLLRELLAWSASRHLETIYLGTTDKFIAAHRFYEKNGFKEIERGLLPNTFPIMSVDTKFYALTLKESAA